MLADGGRGEPLGQQRQDHAAVQNNDASGDDKVAVQDTMGVERRGRTNYEGKGVHL